MKVVSPVVESTTNSANSASIRRSVKSPVVHAHPTINPRATPNSVQNNMSILFSLPPSTFNDLLNIGFPIEAMTIFVENMAHNFCGIFFKKFFTFRV